jgi:hypothetical protein
MKTLREHQQHAARAQVGRPKSPEHRAKLALALAKARAAKAERVLLRYMETHRAPKE